MLSAIVPVRNWPEERIAACARSLLRLKSASLKEIVVVDFGSDPAVGPVASDTRMRGTQNRCRGVEPRRGDQSRRHARAWRRLRQIRRRHYRRRRGGARARPDRARGGAWRLRTRHHASDRSPAIDRRRRGVACPLEGPRPGRAPAAALGPGGPGCLFARDLGHDRRVRFPLYRLGERGQRFRRTRPPLGPQAALDRPRRCPHIPRLAPANLPPQGRRCPSRRQRRARKQGPQRVPPAADAAFCAAARISRQEPCTSDSCKAGCAAHHSRDRFGRAQEPRAHAEGGDQELRRTSRKRH